ncbi:MAG: hypothetical protein AB7O60_07540 [Variibacter sp.]
MLKFPVIAALLVAWSGVVVAAPDAAAYQLEGSYLQGKACRGDVRDPKPLKVTITPDEITYSGGKCTVSDKRENDKVIVVRAACKQRSGTVLAGDVTFTFHNDNEIEMVNKDQNYTAVLYRCPK